MGIFDLPMQMFSGDWLDAFFNWFSQLSHASLEDILREFGYLAILILTFLEGETIVIIAGVFAAQGMMDPLLIALCAFCGSCTSDQVMFSLGKYKGMAILHRFPKIGKNIGRASRLFKKWDTGLILGFRFVYGVRNITPILLGISGVSHKKFLILNVIGAAVWAATFTAGGYYFGKLFEHRMGDVGIGLVVIIVALLLVFMLVRYIRGKKTPDTAECEQHEDFSDLGITIEKSNCDDSALQEAVEKTPMPKEHTNHVSGDEQVAQANARVDPETAKSSPTDEGNQGKK